MRPRAIGSLILTLAMLLSAPVLRAAGTTAPELDLRVEADGWKGSSQADVTKVLRSVASEMLPHFRGAEVEPVHVSNGGGPITLFARERDGAIRVKLESGGNLWAQMSFQFAHELTHVMCRYRAGRNANKWLEESLCETGSLFALRRMGETWKNAPPYPNWKSYAKHLTEYAEKRITDHALPPGTTLARWYAENAEALRKTAEDRPRNTTVAIAILPLLEKSPEKWMAVYYLNQGEIAPDESLADCLKRWRQNTPEKHGGLIRDIAILFDLDLK